MATENNWLPDEIGPPRIRIDGGDPMTRRRYLDLIGVEVEDDEDENTIHVSFTPTTSGQGDGVDDLIALRAIDAEFRADKQGRYVEEEGTPFYFDADFGADVADDDRNVIKPNDTLQASAGRWRRGPRVSESIPEDVGMSAASGTSIELSPADHTHKLPAAITVTTIDERVADTGVTIEDVLLKAGNVDTAGSVKTDTIAEHTADAGVTIDEAILKDGLFYYDDGDGFIEAGFRFRTLTADDTPEPITIATLPADCVGKMAIHVYGRDQDAAGHFMAAYLYEFITDGSGVTNSNAENLMTLIETGALVGSDATPTDDGLDLVLTITSASATDDVDWVVRVELTTMVSS